MKRWIKKVEAVKNYLEFVGYMTERTLQKLEQKLVAEQWGENGMLGIILGGPRKGFLEPLTQKLSTKP